MNIRLVVTALISILLFGCKSYVGTYSPSCVAFSGNKISLNKGEFVWEKFTDMVVLDDDGNSINQFPGYPMQGIYRVEGQTVIMQSAAGEALHNMYLQKNNESLHLLTEDELKSLGKTGEYPYCSLVLGGFTDKG